MQTATLQEDRPTDQTHNQNGNKSNPIINFQKEIDEIARKNHQPSATTLLSDNHTHTLVSQLENSHITADSLLAGLEKVNQIEPGVPLKVRRNVSVPGL
jgi:hypothetical protein